MKRPKRYSYALTAWLMNRVPADISRSLTRNGWNVFGVYELVKEGIALEKKGKLSKGKPTPGGEP